MKQARDYDIIAGAMAKKDPRIDAYIAQAAPFARPILARLRKAVHAGCPDVLETMKWSNPAFEHEGILAGMAAFKAHCSFGLWKERIVRARGGAAEAKVLDAIGKIASEDDLPSEAAIAKVVRLAAGLNEQGVKASSPRRKAPPKPPVAVPADLRAALGKSKKAQETFEGFSPSHRREYVEWITEAKRAATRERRIAQAIAWMVEGKIRNWKYAR